MLSEMTTDVGINLSDELQKKHPYPHAHSDGL